MTGPTTGLGFGPVFDVTASNAAFDFVRLPTREDETQRLAPLYRSYTSLRAKVAPAEPINASFIRRRQDFRHSKSNGIMLAPIEVN
jgi:hypothetical protein